jgi:hypothetical protein
MRLSPEESRHLKLCNGVYGIVQYHVKEGAYFMLGEIVKSNKKSFATSRKLCKF